MRRISVSDGLVCRLACFIALAVGSLGMFASLPYLDSPLRSSVMAGFAGFNAGAIIFAAGLVAIALITPKAAAQRLETHSVSSAAD